MIIKNKAACDCGNNRHAYSAPHKANENIAQTMLFGIVCALVMVGIPNLMALLKCWGVW